ncbi:Tropomyosin like, partial [Tyrophagus putrescentiae]
SSRTRGDGAESPNRFTDGGGQSHHQQHQNLQQSSRRRRSSPAMNSNSNSNNSNNHSHNSSSSKAGSPSDSTEDLSSLRSRGNRQPTAGYPGLAFGSPMFSNTIFKFNLIANELRDLKVNQLKRAEGEVETLHRRLEAIEAHLERGRESLRLTGAQLEEAHQEAVADERLREQLEDVRCSDLEACNDSSSSSSTTTSTSTPSPSKQLEAAEDDRISFLQAQLAAARRIAEESERKMAEARAMVIAKGGTGATTNSTA